MKHTEPALQIDIRGATSAKLAKAHRLNPSDLQGIEPRIRAVLKRMAAERTQGKHRYRELPYRLVECRTIQALAAEYRPQVENLVVLGIGGSALGNIALQTALNSPFYNVQPRERRGGPRLFVIDNVDATYVGDLLDLLDDELPNTLFNVISKSGETAETSSQFLIMRELLRKRLGPLGARRNILVTTDASHGSMRAIVDREGYRSLIVPDGVGGRFSVLSPVGLFSAAMCGIDIEQLLAGAAAMDRRLDAPRLAANPAATIAAVKYLYTQRGKPLHVMMPYSQQLRDMADWYRQLWAESLGKRYDEQGRREVFAGATPIKALGATDQHSQVQLYREGPNDKLIVFLEVEEPARDVTIPHAFADVEAMRYLGGATVHGLLNAEKKATEQALQVSQRPTMTIRFPRISAHAVGQFIYLYEVATTIMGYLLGIDPYDQPAVELGKKITFHLMGRRGYETRPTE
ncbi:MAG: glucose-6-phosphate isomerase [Phycisphaerae bacterium]|nr:glucose-6-phosphate isomerase [Phycisphaerae bacterium]